jgi:PKHD-type hydroxylase|tara:strand:- start:331 stop:945 length:615 start_codon:yes stop_codon:yes gene_type:complete
MNLTNYYWCFKSVLTPRFCDEVIEYANSQKEVMARTGDFTNKKLNKEEVKNLQLKRKSDLVWLNDAWIYKEVIPYVKKANINAGWNFEWDESEHFQFTKYKLNQFYDWHCDSFHKINEKGKIRKLSVTCQLSDQTEYKGGELEFDFRNYDPHMRDELHHVQQAQNVLTKGSIIIFPSFVWHRVKPVTEGTRYSLVLWNLGKPYK